MDGFLLLMMASAAAAGALGGAHCAAMCGGIASAICAGNRGAVPWRRAGAYNLGRITSYTVAGALVGSVGQAGLWLRGDAVLRHGLMLTAGIAMLVLALSLAGWSPLVRAMEGAGSRLWRHIEPCTRHFLPANTVPRAWGLGLLWGWLPCGMVYAVLLTAAATGDAVDGALVMASFGVGTLPNLLAVALFAQKLRRYSDIRAVRVAGAIAIGGFGLYAIAHAVQPGALHAIVDCIASAPAGSHAG